MEIDASELQGKSFACLDNCAMCCLCQPELSMDELARFRKYGLTAGLTREHIQGYTTEEPTAIKLQGGNGACHFLRDRKCSIHDKRPAFCRQFPVHVHALHRIQLNANLSCRGILYGGDSLADFGNEVIAALDRDMMAGILAEARKSVSEFERCAAENGVFQIPERLREAGAALLPLIGRAGGIGKILAFADSPQEIGKMPTGELVALIANTDPPEDLEEIAGQGNYEQFELDNPAWQPVYMDAGLRWRTYRSAGGNIEVMELEPDGKLAPEITIPMGELGLLPPDDGAFSVFREYGEVLNKRDQFLGYAYNMCRAHEYQYDLMTVYLGLLATTILDLWWRAGLVGKILGRNVLDAELAMEGVQAFDMDCLDMPTIGTFF